MKKSLIFLILSTVLLSSVSHARLGSYWSSKKRKKKSSDYETLTNYIAHDIDGDLERPITFDPSSPNYEKSKNIFNFYLIGAASIIMYDRMTDYDHNSSDYDQFKVLKRNMWRLFRFLESEEKKCNKEYFSKLTQPRRSQYNYVIANSFKNSNQFASALHKLITHSTFQNYYEIAELHGDYSHVPVENRNTDVPRDKLGREDYVSSYYSQIYSLKKGKNGEHVNVDVEKVRRRHIWEMYKRFFGGTGSDEDIKSNSRKVPNMGCHGYYKDFAVKVGGVYTNLNEVQIEAFTKKRNYKRERLIREWKREACPRVEKIHKCYQNLLSDLNVFEQRKSKIIDGEETLPEFEYRNNYFKTELQETGALNY